jgi:hypothetical protein
LIGGAALKKGYFTEAELKKGSRILDMKLEDMKENLEQNLEAESHLGRALPKYKIKTQLNEGLKDRVKGTVTNNEEFQAKMINFASLFGMAPLLFTTRNMNLPGKDYTAVMLVADFTLVEQN